MKKLPALVLLSFVFGPLAGQQIREERSVVNIGVPVRVFQGRNFISTLNLEDFEVLEDGIPQKLEAVYLVHQTAVERRDELNRFEPPTGRHFYLLFEITEYVPKIGEALADFAEHVLSPGDKLTVVTPLKTYRLRPKTLESQSKAQIAQQLINLLRNDTLIGSSDYLDQVEEVEEIAQTLALALIAAKNAMLETNPAAAQINPLLGRTENRPEDYLPQYIRALSALQAYRLLDEERMLKFASELKKEDTQKYVFVFYQKEFIPEVEPQLIQPYLYTNLERPDLQEMAANLTFVLKQTNSYDMEAIKKAYADASIAIHFLFITRPAKHAFGLTFKERSDDIYSAFKEMAVSTGGFFEASNNPRELLKDAVDSAENYYLLYYAPLNRERDGRFRKITVRVKAGGYQVIHRQGYIAD